MKNGCITPFREPVHLPQGALRQSDGSVLWRIWAPHSKTASLVLCTGAGRHEIAMTREEEDYFVHREADAAEGLRYLYKLSDGGLYPDPASRWQPEGVHRPSAVYSPGSFEWSYGGWRGVAREDLVIYELHVGTFTPEGTFAAVIPRLPQLAELGITAVEIMPVAQFPGGRNWGYDGVFPYAAQNSYGGPRGLQELVDAAHRTGMAAILDVVYNHFGPEGNYLAKFGPYFTDRYHTPWGGAVNYDGPDCDAVRRFILDNALMWVRDFHFDGLRLDATQTIFDLGARHIVAEIRSEVQAEAARQQRTVHVIAETNQNDICLVQPAGQGGYGLSAVWNDDFHHSVHALLTGQRDGYYLDFGRPEHLAKAINDVFVYDGCYSPFRRRRHGSEAGRTDRTRFVVSIQTHDQVGNRAAGDRLASLLPPEAQRLACGLLLLLPNVPLLFMGEEYGESSPFPFFCSFEDPELIEAVRRGRQREFADLAFEWNVEVPDPQSEATFLSAKLSWEWPEGSPQEKLRRLYQDLLAARKHWPALRDRRHTKGRLMRPSSVGEKDSKNNRPEALILERGKDNGIIAVANLTAGKISLPRLQMTGRKAILSTEDVRYGGARRIEQELDQFLPYEMIVF
jgi:maltooligosyltrehalose trehalohydrolase